MAFTHPVTDDTLYFKGSATEAFAKLRATKTNVELLNATHDLHCGPNCKKEISCEFLHHSRPSQAVAKKETSLSVYNTKTSGLFTFMGEAGQYNHVSQQHEVNLWPLLESVLGLIDKARSEDQVLHFDYTNWAQKHDTSIESILVSSCRDSVQWLACWLGKAYDSSHLALQYTAFATMADDVCIPPLDLVHGRFRMFRRSALDMICQMQTEGWDRDATSVLVSLVLQYLLQYAEKVEVDQDGDPRARLHVELSRSSTVWDSTVYRARTADTYGVLICIARVCDTGTLPHSWLFEAGICNCIAMDIGKMSARIYQHDVHMPTKTTIGKDFGQKQKKTEMARRSCYHSLYLDLMDRLLANGAPEPLPQFGSGGFLFAYMVDRYRERHIARRIPPSHQVSEDINRIWGKKAADPRVEGLFRLRALGSSEGTGLPNKTVALPKEILLACRNSQQERLAQFRRHASEGVACNSQAQENRALMEKKNLSGRSALTQHLHRLASEATGPKHLQELLCSVDDLGSLYLTPFGDEDDIWALSVGCQTGCTGNCEWLAFSEYLVREIRKLGL